MKISAISFASRNSKTINSSANEKTSNSIGSSHSIEHFTGMDILANLNRVSFKGANENKFKLALSNEELDRRTKEGHFGVYKMLDVDSVQYENLADGDKKALVHLVKAANIIDEVYLRQDDVDNIPFKKELQKRAESGDSRAEKTLMLFNAQKGVNAKDREGKDVGLVVNHPKKLGKGFYPAKIGEPERTLSVSAFHNILIDMLKNGEDEEVRKILNQRTMVLADGDKLKAVDYTDYFKDKFAQAADELDKAADTSMNEEFNKYLILQANALRMNNPLLDALADKKWAQLQDTPLEFTVTRESYDDRLTPTVGKNPELKALLKKYGIQAYPKDNLGARVGIVNKEGTDYILKVKKHLPLMAENMPFNDEYDQNLSEGKEIKQSMVDVDIVHMAGQTGAYRGAISLASNLPNSDKLSVQTGGGKRNVYHIQNRIAKYSDNAELKLNVLLDKSQHKYYDPEALHDFTILHENIHSLGPQKGLEALGVYKNTIEEHKADMGSIVMANVLTKEGFYTAEQEKKIITSFVVGYVFKGEDKVNAHRIRNTMQHNYFIKHGAIDVSKDGVMKIDYDRVIECSKEMLEKAIRIQLEGNPLAAKEYIDEHAVWSDELEAVAVNLRKVDKQLNAKVVSPLAQKLASEV